LERERANARCATGEDERIASFERAIDALRREVEAELGDHDLAHIRRIASLSRRLQVLGRALLHVSFEPATFGLGVCALWLHKQLEAHWRTVHNVRHHHYTNIAGRDPDMQFGIVRLSARVPYRS
jgi:fatty acid desaturase